MISSDHAVRIFIQAAFVVVTALPTWTVAQQIDGKPSSRAADAELTQTPSEGVSVICVDANGDLVEKVEVHLFQYRKGENGRYEHFGPFISDMGGKVICSEAVFSTATGHYDRWIYARVPGRMVGVARCVKRANQKTGNRECKVTLFPSCSVEGQVTVPDGFDPTQVIVNVRNLLVFSSANDESWRSFPRSDRFPGLDTSLPKIFECRPDSSGHVRFDDVPKFGWLTLTTVGKGLGEAQWRNEHKIFADSINLKIEKECSVAGRILNPDGQPAVGMKVSARLQASGPDGRVRKWYSTTFRTITDGNGEFGIDGIPHTEFRLSVEDPKERWVIRPIEDLIVARESTKRFDLNLEKGVMVTGRVLDGYDNPVEGAGIAALTDSREGAGLDENRTDANGRFQLKLPAGKARLYFSSLPDGFVYPRPQIIKNLDIKADQSDIKDLDFFLSR